jgi:kynurenine 3-monooxygenase
MDNIVIVGAGLVGSLQAILFAKQGHNVAVYERRPDMRSAEIVAGRSINLALSDRGWKALRLAGVEEAIMEMAIPMKGRMMHAVDGSLTFQPYGKEGQAIYSVSRGGLNAKLMDEAEKYENVQFHFNQRCADIDLEKNVLQLEHTATGAQSTVKADRIIGTDGAFSAVRARLQKTDRFNYSQFYLEHGYKELVIPPDANGAHQLDKNALHIWPRGEYMLIALANLDGSFTCTLFFPFEGKRSFSSLQSEKEVVDFFKEVFPDALELMPTLKTDYFENPTSSLVTIRCTPWNVSDKILLMGDASHAIVPFYGQGMNSGFEDCSVLNELMVQYSGDWEKVFNAFSDQRKADADAISELALQNFIEMRDLVADEQFLLRKKIEKRVSELYPDKWIPLYSQVTFTHIPYAEALAAGKKQRAIMDEIMKLENIEQRWDSPEIATQIIAALK